MEPATAKQESSGADHQVVVIFACIATCFPFSSYKHTAVVQLMTVHRFSCEQNMKAWGSTDLWFGYCYVNRISKRFLFVFLV